MVTEKQKANLIPLNKRTKSEQRKIQVAGGIASGISRNLANFASEKMVQHWDAEIDDESMKAKLRRANLPPTHFGQTMYYAWKNSGKNPAMLRTMLEMMGILKQGQTSVTVNNNTRESPLKDFTKEELMKIAGLTERTGKTSEN